MLARKALSQLKARVDPNEYPGAPLLGINGAVIVTHGASTHTGVANAVKGAAVAAENRLIDHIRENVENFRREEQSAAPVEVVTEEEDT